MNDFEAVIDNWINRVIDYAADSDTGLKYACINASPVVGRYDGGTQQIAKGTKRSVSTVENWAHAHWLYKAIRSNGHREVARGLWRNLPASHWWKAWDIHTAGFDALYYLKFAHAHNVSGRGMMAEYQKDRDAGTAPMQYKRKAIALRGICDELLRDKETPRKLREWILAMPEEVGK